MESLRLAGIIEDSVVDGPGVRFTVFVQGCPHRCEGCHNENTHDFNGGFRADIHKLSEKIIQSHIKKLTFTGGEPFCQADGLARLARLVEAGQPGTEIITYTGYLYEELLEKARTDSGVREFLIVTDYFIDGKYEQGKKTINCFYRGSSNQRILDIRRYPNSVKARLIERLEDFSILRGQYNNTCKEVKDFMKINAMLHNKTERFDFKECQVDKIIELPSYDFLSLLKNLLKDRSFISENIDVMYIDENEVFHCILALGEGSDDGILIEAEGYNYARYSAFVPNARQIVNSMAEDNYLYNLDGSKQAVSVTVRSLAAGLSGKLAPGDIISIIAPDYRKTGVTVIPAELRYVEVIAVTAATGNDASPRSQDGSDRRELPSAVTLLVLPEQAKILAELESDGKLHIALVYRGMQENADLFIQTQEEIIGKFYSLTDEEAAADGGD